MDSSESWLNRALESPSFQLVQLLWAPQVNSASLPPPPAIPILFPEAPNLPTPNFPLDLSFLMEAFLRLPKLCRHSMYYDL